eukprot:CAMPEP_0194357688 /NCGR_PEP_ID=MMETSP0174-20130528/5138_1 /TAXON_ID=216777 /ORGANISM="Proboscia alata, Strain PI-D3" /LENGTH=404 /DNA_ID=CAMNT_0039127811 /DNA_START=74 /DNA_END=1288 /DNA_ORIENTATION=+
MSTTDEVGSPKASPRLVDNPVPIEFVHDLEHKLGRANGNVFHRKPGLDGVHDGQVMVRLKKKRFIVIDYECDNEKKKVCGSPLCEKVGFPKSLYDSDPSETLSLYLRSGLCFICQRSLNEKRRTQRKRKSDVSSIGMASPGSISQGASSMSASNASLTPLLNGFGGPARKRIKFHDEIIELSNNEILIQSPMEGVRNAEHNVKAEESYTYTDIGGDLCAFVHENAENVDRLVEAVEKATVLDASSKALATASAVKDAVTAAVSVMEMPNMADAAVTAAVSGLAVPDVTEGVNSQSASETITEECSQHSLLGLASNNAINDEVTGLYENALQSMRKSIYLLNQWKISWDLSRCATIATDAPKTAPNPEEVTSEQNAMTSKDTCADSKALKTNKSSSNANVQVFGV